MIKFLSKFTREGVIVAWRILDDGVEYNIANRGVYHEFYFQHMLDSGYKFHDYDCQITTPDGFELKDVVESTEYLSDTELIDLIDSLDVGMLEEKDIVQYFDRNVNIQYVDILEPSEPSILTRDQFITYLDLLKNAKDKNITSFKHMNINSITSKDALYKLEEVIANIDNARSRFVRMFDNHMMSSIHELRNLLSFYEVGDSKNTDMMVKILKKFYAYGVPGLNANIISIKYDLYPTVPYNDLNQSTVNNAKLKYGLRNNQDYKVYSIDVNGAEYSSLAGDEYFDTNAFIGGMNISSKSPEPVSKDYSIIAYGDKKVPPRIIIEMLSDDGIRATFISDCDEAHLYSGTSQIFTTLKLFSYKTMDNFHIPLSTIAEKGEEYILESTLIRAYIADQTSKSTLTPKYKSTFDIMTGIGVSPYYAPMYINRLLGEGLSQYTDINDIKNFVKLHYYCSDTFRDGFSSRVIEKYGSDDEEFNDKLLSEQLEYINEEISNLQSMGKYLVKPEIPEGTLKLASAEYDEWFTEYWDNEVGNVNFVMSLINGDQHIGNIADGMNIDNSINGYRIFLIVYAAYVAYKCKESSPLSCNEFLRNHLTDYIDLSLLFIPKKKTAIGCSKDIVLYRNDMAKTSTSLLYITKVFRENANTLPKESNRHYGFECVVFDKSPATKGSQIFNSLTEQIINDMQQKGLIDHLYIVYDMIALTIMSILNSEHYIKPVDGICYIDYSTKLFNEEIYSGRVKLADEYYNLIKNGSLFVKKYSTNYDFCENQFSKANMKCNYYCVNASINPWVVNPRERFLIPEYNLYVNYYKQEELSSVLPAVVLNKIKDTGSKVIPCLRESFTSAELFPVLSFGSSIQQEIKLAQAGFFLSKREREDLDNYVARTTYDMAKAKEDGTCVMNTILKSDIHFSMFKPYTYLDGVDQEQTYRDEITKGCHNLYISNMQPRMLSPGWFNEEAYYINNYKLIEDNNISTIKMERVKFQEIPYEFKEMNNKLIIGDFLSNSNVYISNGVLNCVNFRKFKLLNITLDDLYELCDLNIAIQINDNSFIIKTINGLVKVGA